MVWHGHPDLRPEYRLEGLVAQYTLPGVMDFGINISTSAESWKVVARAEALGFSHAWFFDTHLINAAIFVAMAAAAMRIKRIKLCAGVLIPSNRIAPVAANALALLSKLAPGRIECGISTGFTARRSMGLPATPMADVEAYVSVMRGLLAGQTVSAEIDSAPRKIRFLIPELELINTAPEVPFHISALGPKGREMTARLGLRWIVPARSNEQTIEQINDMHMRWLAAGRETEGLYTTVQCGGSSWKTARRPTGRAQWPRRGPPQPW